jgi:hypothetical protein
MTNIDLFQVLATEDAEEQERIAGSRAVIAVQARAKTRFSNFIAKATTPDEVEARIGLIETNLRTIASEVCEEYGFEDADRLFLASTVALGGGHASDCGCGFCENKGNLPGSKKDTGPLPDVDDDNPDNDTGDEDEKFVESRVACACGCGGKCAGKCECGDDGCSCSTKSSKTAAGVETGDSYQQKSVSLPSADASGLGGPNEPAIDKGTAGGLSAIDVDSVRNKLVNQDVTDKAKYDAADFDPSSPLRKTVDADQATQPEFNESQSTKTFGDQKNQADPVTSSALDNWLVVT